MKHGWHETHATGALAPSFVWGWKPLHPLWICPADLCWPVMNNVSWILLLVCVQWLQWLFTHHCWAVKSAATIPSWSQFRDCGPQKIFATSRSVTVHSTLLSRLLLCSILPNKCRVSVLHMWHALIRERPADASAGQATAQPLCHALKYQHRDVMTHRYSNAMFDVYYVYVYTHIMQCIYDLYCFVYLNMCSYIWYAHVDSPHKMEHIET